MCSFTASIHGDSRAERRFRAVLLFLGARQQPGLTPIFQPVAFTADVDRSRVMQRAVEDGRRDYGVSEDGPPIAATLDHRRCFAQVNDDLVAAVLSAQRNPTMVLGMRHHPVPGRAVVQRDPVGFVVGLHPACVFAHPDILAGILPRYGVPAALPGDIRIPGHTPRLVVAEQAAQEFRRTYLTPDSTFPLVWAR